MTAGIKAGSNNDGYIQVNGNDIITALSGGNVGIGTSSPTTKLHVNGDITCDNFNGNINGTVDDWIIHGGDTDTKFGFPTDNTFQIETAGDERFKITSAGSIGIGGDPDRQLTLNASATTRFNIKSGTTSTTGIEFGDSDDINAGFIVYDNSDNSFEVGVNGTGQKLRIASDGDQTFTSTTGNAQFTFKKGDSPSGEETVFARFDRNGTVIGGVGGAAMISGGESGNNMTLANVNGGQVVLGTGTGGGATARLRVASDGKVAIGTGTANELLEVAGAINFTGPKSHNKANSGTLTFESATAFLQSRGANTSTRGKIGFNIATSSGSSGITPLEINSSGQTKLNISTDNATTEPLVIRNGGSGAATSVGIAFVNGDESSTGAGTLARIKAHDAGSFDSDLAFETGLKSGWSNNTTERFRITSSGQISISSSGSTDGVAKLTIIPNTRTTAYDATDGDTWHDFVLHQNGDAQRNSVGLAFLVSNDPYHKNAGTGISCIKNGTASDYGCDLAFITRPQSAAAGERMRILHNGNVGIGTTDPSVPLHVVGGMLSVQNNSADVAKFQSTFANTKVVIEEVSNANSNPGIRIQKKFANGNAIGSGHWMGDIRFEGWDGSQYRQAGIIECRTQAAASSGSVPAFITIGCNSGTTGVSSTNRLIVSHQGDIFCGTASFNSTYDDITGGGGIVCGSGNVSNGGLCIRTGSSGTGRLYFGDNSGNAGGRRAGFIQYAHGTDTMKIGANEVDVLDLTDDKIMVWKDIKAHANASRDIGAGGARFDTIFCVTLNESSDRRLKNTIQPSDLGLSFINKLNPVSYKRTRTEEQKPDNRTHYGLIAQEVEEVIKEEGKTLDDFAAVAEIEGEYGINYSEMISPLIKAIQELSAEVSTLKTKIAVLESS